MTGSSPVETLAGTLAGFVDELVGAGVRDVVVCPGSRSTPLALAVRANPAIETRVLLDERSAGFFALGLAKASRRPVAVVVTSGTAAANLLPAAVEASLGRVPLLLLTADRPAELRDRGAPQTIDQVGLFGTHAKWFAELPLIDGRPETAAHWRSVAGRAAATTLEGPAGPVHLNLPFREPLVPEGDLAPRRALIPGSAPVTRRIAGRRALPAEAVAELAATLRGVERGLIVAGPQDDPDLPRALARLAAVTGFPILADPLSLARLGPHDRSNVIARADLTLRPGPWREAHAPELVIRFGAPPTSKPLNQFVAEAAPAHYVVDGDGGWREPLLLPTTFVHAEGTWLADALADLMAPSAGSAWLDAWRLAEAATDTALRDWHDGVVRRGELFEGSVFHLLAEAMWSPSILWSSSSMPVRDMDAWLPSSRGAIRPLANRGANGIDGVVSSALGAVAAGEGLVVLVVGDIAFLHDLNALVAAQRLGLSIVIVLVNNDGGGIFSFLPQASVDAPGSGLPLHYEELFGTPHGLDLGPLIEALGARHVRVGADDLRERLKAAVDTGVGEGGVWVVELRTDRTRNVELHREAAAAVGEALGRLLEPAAS